MTFSSSLLCACLAATAAVAAAEPVLLEIEDGTLLGRTAWDGAAVDAFLGVPFARPPVGNLRWESPQSPEPWEGTLDASKRGKSCMQRESSTWIVFSEMSEDCLSLNVWKPASDAHDNSTGPLPVLLFFYGGGYTEGSIAFPLYQGNRIVEQSIEDGAPVITANYRLNIFGYLGSPELLATGSDAGRPGSSGNWGLQDQRLAMMWIRRNAEYLNADPSRLMIFGESAGAGSVANHLAATASFPYYTRALMQSGAPAADWVSTTLDTASSAFDSFVERAGCGEDADVVSCLRALDTDEVTAAQPGGVDWAPVIDGSEILAHPQQLGQAGKLNTEVPMVLGSNADEASMFIGNFPTDSNRSDAVEYIERCAVGMGYPPGVGQFACEKAIEQYSYLPATELASKWWWAVERASGDLIFTCPARQTARWGGGKATYVYFFQRTVGAIALLERVAGRPFGAFHGLELALVFDSPDLILTPGEKQLSKAMRKLWTSFAADGEFDPETWPQYAASTDLSLVLDLPHPTPVAGIRSDDCDFWDSLLGE